MGVSSVPAACDRVGHIHSLWALIAPRRLAARHMVIFSVPAACDRVGILTAFGHELLPAGWLPGRWGVFSVPAACDWVDILTAFVRELLPAGAKNFSPLQNRPVSLERTRAGASGGRGVHDGTGLSGSGAFLAKIDRCSRGKTVPVFSLQKPQNP